MFPEEGRNSLNTLYLTFAGMLIAGLVTGAATVAVLVSRRLTEPLAAAVGALGFASAVWCISSVTAVFGTAQAFAASLALTLGFGAGGYALASSLLYRLSAPEKLPEQLEAIPEADAGPVVFVWTCYEPETYEPRYTASALAILEDEEEATLGVGVTPLLYTAAKARYRGAGGKSPSAKQIRAIAEEIEDRLGKEFLGRVGVASCSGRDRLVAVVVEAVRAGSRHVIVAEVSVGESLQMAQAKREVDAMRLDELGVRVSYTAPLWGSDRIAEMIAERVLHATSDRDTTGVVLVAHGQNPNRARRNPEFDENETAFTSRIRLLLSEKRVPESNVRIAWAGWNEPDVTSTVRHLAALGCSRILVVPATYALETISTTLDLAQAAKQARVDEAVPVVSLSAWRDDPAVVDELTARVNEALASRYG